MQGLISSLQFGPIGVGAVFYVEHTLHLFPHLEDADEGEANLLRALRPVVFFLVLTSIVVHGLSIPALSAIYRAYGVQPIADDAVQLRRQSIHVPAPANARPDSADGDYFVAYNRFSRPAPNHRRTVLFDGRSIGRLPLVREHDAAAAAAASDASSVLGHRGSSHPRRDAGVRPDTASSRDSIDDVKLRDSLRADSLRKLG